MMKVGIIFGGNSREREVSFAGGRTVYDSLDKTLFEPVPIFLDSTGNFIHLDWQYLYKGSIRDFYPPIDFLPESLNNYQIYRESLGPLTKEDNDALIIKIGTRIRLEDLPAMIDFAFLTLHGPYGEDGTLQGMLQFYDIPYSGAGIYPSALGIDKSLQKHLFQSAGFKTLSSVSIPRHEWDHEDRQRKYFDEIKKSVSFPCVIKPASQGSSIGVRILHDPDFYAFKNAMNEAFFIKEIRADEWAELTTNQEAAYVRKITDLQDGIGLPVLLNDQIIHHPEEVLHKLRETFVNDTHQEQTVYLEAYQGEPTVLAEAMVEGREFSCIVIQKENGDPLALPPTEIIKKGEVFDYRAKYLPGISHKKTPIDLPDESIQAIRSQCEELFTYMHSNVYARIDGFITQKGHIYLNDPNTTSGMLPSSFFFHQAAEIGLSPSQFLTYIIRSSIAARAKTAYPIHAYEQQLQALDQHIQGLNKEKSAKFKVAVILGGYSSERHISVESGRNVFEKLASSQKYEPIPVFLTGNPKDWEFYQIPINLLLKDNADDIRNKIENFRITGILDQIIQEGANITAKYTSPDYDFYPRKITLEELAQKVDFAFVGLHGRPGEDGSLIRELQKLNLPYNGPDPDCMELTIDKYQTNQFLKQQGFLVADHSFISQEQFKKEKTSVVQKIESQIGYPLVAKPSDDGCSSAVKKIDNRQQLEEYMEVIFRSSPQLPDLSQYLLSMSATEEFPPKDYFMVEQLVEKGNAERFLEITGGLLTHYDDQNNLHYEIFEPSEALAEQGILSLEEKFLAGEGQNITPARFADDHETNKLISDKVKQVLKDIAIATGISGYSRIDAFVRVYDNHEVDVVVIEINTLPGLTPATAIFHQAALNNYRPVDFLNKIITFGSQKK